MSKGVITDLVLVKVSIKYMSLTQRLSTLIDAIVDKTSADRGMIRASVKTLPPEATKPVTTAIARARRFYRESTLPWDDKGGWRAVPIKQYEKFAKQQTKLLDEVELCHKDLIAKYDDVIKQAAGLHGTLSGQIDIPTKKEAEECLQIDLDRSVPADMDDVRLKGLSDNAADELKKNIEKAYDKKINKGVTDLIRRLLGLMENISERMEKENPRSLVDMIKDTNGLISSIEAMNITGSKVISEACQELRAALTRWSPETVRDMSIARADVGKKVSSVQQKLSEIAGGE